MVSTSWPTVVKKLAEEESKCSIVLDSELGKYLLALGVSSEAGPGGEDRLNGFAFPTAVDVVEDVDELV